MDSPLDANCLSLEQIALVYSLSDTTLRMAGNPAYLKLEKDNFALHNRVDELQCVIVDLTCIYYLDDLCTEHS